jgi:hypothetical protein
MAYTSEKPKIAPSAEELRERIPGWGVDLDPNDRPAVPREVPGIETGAHWDFPERQAEKWPRERSIEHRFLTPVFGTSCPPKGVSGAIRRLSYRKYSEAQTAHWLLLIAADRVDAMEEHARSFLTLRPDNPITQTGLMGEITHRGFSSRFRQKRADVVHQPLDPVIVAGPWVAAGVVAVVGARRLARRTGRLRRAA